MRGDELIRKLAANEPTADETLRAAQENLVPTKLVSFLQRIGHGGFLLQKSEPGWYAPEKRYWGAPKFLSVADFVRDYGQYKDENALGTDFHIRILGTPPIFCLDLDQDGEHMLEKCNRMAFSPSRRCPQVRDIFKCGSLYPAKKHPRIPRMAANKQLVNSPIRGRHGSQRSRARVSTPDLSKLETSRGIQMRVLFVPEARARGTTAFPGRCPT